MKIAVYLVESLAPSAGGNFSYYDRMIRAIDDYRFDGSLEICFAGRMSAGDVTLKKPYFQLSSSRSRRFFELLGKTGVLRLISRLFSANADLCNKEDIRRLEDQKVDIILFPKQFFRDVENFPFMTMNWDAGHKSTFAFPEFLEAVETRELWYRLEMQKAMTIIVESESSKKEFSEYFAVPKHKLEVVPLFPGGVVEMSVDESEQLRILQEHSLKKEEYFFYPAQFWAHKNHYNLVCAFKTLVDHNPQRELKLIFTGSDKGNKDYIRKLVTELDLKERVMLMGFVSNEAIYTFYKNSIALVMPTFLGPTNMPVLEATALGTAVICSDLSGHREICEDGALYVQPTDRMAWSDAMTAVLDVNFRSALIARAAVINAKSHFNIRSAITCLEEIFLKYIQIRKTFD